MQAQIWNVFQGCDSESCGCWSSCATERKLEANFIESSLDVRSEKWRNDVKIFNIQVVETAHLQSVRKNMEVKNVAF